MDCTILFLNRGQGFAHGTDSGHLPSVGLTIRLDCHHPWLRNATSRELFHSKDAISNHSPGSENQLNPTEWYGILERDPDRPLAKTLAMEPYTQYQSLFARIESFLDRLERRFPDPAPPPPDWDHQIAWRWWRQGERSGLIPVPDPHHLQLDDLLDVDDQKLRLVENTRQFVAGLPANNALLTGARGTGKSSLIKALLNEFSGQGLRMIEVERDQLFDLPLLLESLSGRKERFILFCDDLSFETGEAHYRALKSVLDGSLAAPPANVLIYATSNRRHLMPEFMSENLEARHEDGEIHPGEAVEEKIALSDRFGLWLSFYPCSQEAYLSIAAHWVVELGGNLGEPSAFRRSALQWALLRSSRSGRSAWHFARHWVGQQGLSTTPAFPEA